MISIKIEEGRFKNELGEMTRKAQRSAAIALTKTAWHAKAETVKRMKNDIDRPTDFTLNSMAVKSAVYKGAPQRSRQSDGSFHNFQAARTNLSASVEVKDWQTKYVRNIVKGLGESRRHIKRFEKSLQAAGAMPYGWACVPAKGMTLDGYGNVGRGIIMKIISQIGTELLSGYQNTSRKVRNAETGKMEKSKSMLRNQKRNGTFFAMQPGNRQGLPPGIYQRFRFGKGWGTRMVFLFVKAAFYKPQIDFEDIGKVMISRYLQVEFNKAMAS